MTSDIEHGRAGLVFDEILDDLMEIAKEDDKEAAEELKAAEEALRIARNGRDIARRQLQNAFLATGRNSDGTERKQRTKRTPPE